ncbi:MAG: hypothetical protein R6U68_12030 [Desulfobacteraceae bacterium]
MKIINCTDIGPAAFDNDVAENIKGRVLIGKDDSADNFFVPSTAPEL